MKNAVAVVMVVYGIVYLAILKISLWAMVTTSLCSSQMVVKAQTNLEAISCFEFWLYRYQILFTGIIAIWAAWTAWRIGARQIAEARREAATALYSLHRADRQEMVERLDMVNTLFNSIKSIEGVFLSSVAGQRRVLDSDRRIRDAEEAYDNLKRRVAAALQSRAKASENVFLIACGGYLSDRHILQQDVPITVLSGVEMPSIEALYRRTADLLREEIARIDRAIAPLDEQIYEGR